MNANFGILPKLEQRIRSKRDPQAAEVDSYGLIVVIPAARMSLNRFPPDS